jgi:hypothetical protein
MSSLALIVLLLLKALELVTTSQGSDGEFTSTASTRAGVDPPFPLAQYGT